MNVSIECGNAWNYLPRAAGLASELLKKYGTKITQLSMLPSDGGVYEIIKDGSLIFSKKKLDRFPDDGEIVNLIENN